MAQSDSPDTGLNKNLLILHFTVFIWGFTGVLGKLISITAINLVWYRVLIAFVTLFLYFNFKKVAFKLNRKTVIQLFCTGALVGGHWILFFGSIKASTLSVSLVCLSAITLFTAIFEPIFNRKNISKLEIAAGLLIITGIVLVFKFERHYTKGIIMGLCSAAAASLFSIINAQQVRRLEAAVIGFYELIGAFCWISLYILVTGGFNNFAIPGNVDMGYLLILGTVCTSLAYVAGVSVMREFSAFKVALITNLEPVYGIIMSFLFFREMKLMTLGFWVGALIILSTVFLFPLAQKQVTRYRTR